MAEHLCNHLLKNANGKTSLFTLNGLPVEAVSCPKFAQGKLQVYYFTGFVIK
jgi:hypothetical protein